jgi:hypothetical protein
MSILEKIISGVSIAIVIIAGTLCAWYYVKSQRQEAEIAKLRMQILDCARREQVISDAIKLQNAAIEAARIDTVYVDKMVKEVITKYAGERETVIKNIEKDSTCENRMSNIADMLRRFYGVRPEGRDAH